MILQDFRPLAKVILGLVGFIVVAIPTVLGVGTGDMGIVGGSMIGTMLLWCIALLLASPKPRRLDRAIHPVSYPAHVDIDSDRRDTMRECAYCGTLNEANGQKCVACGAPLSARAGSR